jgi:hypothetical protein
MGVVAHCVHARPERARTLRALALAGAGAGVVGLTVLGLGQTAQAATGSEVWNAVAACESGGNWAADTGNGYYGGLQFSQQTWDAYGGTSYAPLASEASPAEQVTVAQRVLADQGPGAWPVCGPRAGLSGAAGAISTLATPGGQVGHSTRRSRREPVLVTDGLRYIVRLGDTLSSIANRFSVAGGWQQLFHVNRPVIGSNPNVLRIGELLIVPKS